MSFTGVVLFCSLLEMFPLLFVIDILGVQFTGVVSSVLCVYSMICGVADRFGAGVKSFVRARAVYFTVSSGISRMGSFGRPFLIGAA